MSKGYWIAHVSINDVENFKAKYTPLADEALAAHGGRILARGGDATLVEGEVKLRTVVVEFDSLDAAKACYRSDMYQKAKAVRTAYSDADIIIVEGI